MKKYLFVTIAGIAMIAMKQVDRMEMIKYRTYQNHGIREKKILYCLSVPKGGRSVTIKGSHEQELQIFYPDSSYIYITNDTKSGSPLNYKNIASLSKEIYTKKLLEDTVLLTGIQNNDRLWKESKLGVIVIGYVNVHSEKKDLYDKSLASIKKR